MGIKFLCPNGHKLNVKSFLSGKKAICPQCGARVIVPTESAMPADGAVPAAHAAPAVAESAPVRHQSGAADTAAAGPLDALLDDDAIEALEAPELTAGLQTDARPAAQPSALSTDAIAEAPGAVWYVRPATGGQYGPASADIMRNWLQQGRVSASSLVWHAPWPEWRSAAATFPELGPAPGVTSRPPLPYNGTPPAGMPAGQVVQTVDAGPPEVNASPTVPPLAQASRNRRRKNDASLIFSAILLAISLILVIVLWLVWPAKKGGSEPEPAQPPAAADEPLI